MLLQQLVPANGSFNASPIDQDYTHSSSGVFSEETTKIEGVRQLDLALRRRHI